MENLIQRLSDLGVTNEDHWFYVRLGNRLNSYAGFCLVNSWPWQVTTYGTLHDMVDYAQSNKEQGLSLSFWM
jgi:hypothetical protein